MTIQQEAEYQSDIEEYCSQSGDIRPESRRVCEYLYMVEHNALGFTSDSQKTCNVKLGPCKDVSALYKGVCDLEEKFMPIAAIVAGLFGVNIQINAMGCAYRIVNSQYGHVWPSGALEYKDRTGWCLTNLPLGCVIKKPVPEPKREQHCYHRGTYRAYTRLNSLRVIEVASDGYCGFHAVSTLLDGTSAKAGFERRRRLSEITAAFVSANLRHRSDIETYLKVNNQVDVQGLTQYLMTTERWLDVQDLRYMLEAHEKTLGLITENSSPIYKPTCAHVLIKDNHYEPLLPV
ncbi:Hypothetical protein SMAX5B_008374 [Scophthalmus maximus]|uniref:OTU domain-containing protein n=1 Tax=Scophthalmus maximus TaxID=52904 RepID=A0A2U9CYI5_SCOMX|nr:Hypothetical protein SMAX5B_008374 [Scophthalmus maximus]